MSEQKIKIGITQGDINGIGWEVIIKCFADSRMTEICTPVIYGSARAAEFYKRGIEEAEGFQFTTVKSAREARARKVNLVDTGLAGAEIRPGEASPEAGAAAADALRAAVRDLKEGGLDALVTAPINKESIQSDGFRFTGHTEFLAAEFGGEPLMMMCSEMLRVGLATIHLPLAEVSRNITRERIVTRLRQLRKALITDFSIVEPRIAVLALNPHSGDGGLLGGEEQQTIAPAVRDAVGEGVLAFGPMSADGFFASGAYAHYDAVLAMYHDQGLAPFKALTPQGVNVTAALKVVRTSPDHGVAYDIAGKGVADPSSMRQAVYMAVDIWQSRRLYAEMSRNPLRRYEREKGADVSVKDLHLASEDED